MNDDDNMNSSYSDDSITISIGDDIGTTFNYTGDVTTTGIIAQDIGSIVLDSSVYSNGNYTINANSIWSVTDEVKAATISTAKHTIDIDELAEVFETVKRRLLILTPSFEMHEKYPMLKELYDEYKAMEKLLSGPDRSDDE
jgi:hypothetical protein